MFEWLFTSLVLTIGFIILVTGFIKYVLLGWILYLLIMVVLWIIARIWLCFRKQNTK